jgi:hypothetical protein
MVWRSREPGPGPVIPVDGHLVVLTKTGDHGVEVSVLTTPGWEEPRHLQVPEGPRGRIDKLT